MLSEAATCNAVIGLDVGKFSHWACHVSRRGEVLGSGPVANTEHDLDGLLGRAGAGTPVVVDQVRNIGSLAISRAGLDAEIAAPLAEDGACSCPLSVPGIGPRTASEPAISINISDFPDHDHLASCCGIAPRNRQSGKSISSVSSSRQGNKRLKNLLIFSCSSLSRSKDRFGDYYRRCRDRGMSTGRP